ncbi:hypothetical protein I553_0115 [Mycobacterium xenopi 4042]|uniref:Uncharacterized protein n=1 Tax=Mycobacterium xenopi 4042 TaxID=1299334 RepID=X7YL50_MYCXE|nr:hypothetical protein I553_0115 [Mycobacterium xenopi 4042]EUA33559.1 hypothetical protein I552_4335 [Mycobacterium xenopi 3993]
MVFTCFLVEWLSCREIRTRWRVRETTGHGSHRGPWPGVAG